MSTETKRETLSIHETLAVYRGGHTDNRSHLRTNYPPIEFLDFEITEYTKYEKPGRWGDEKQTRQSFVKSEQKKHFLDFIEKELSPGDKVVLHWHHDQVTRKAPSGTSGTGPERVITAIEKA